MAKDRIIHYEWRNKPQEVVIDGRQFKFKSLIEYRWAQYLQCLFDLGAILSWDYEPKQFLFKERFRHKRVYTPDFFVTEQAPYGKIIECYHETKTSLRQTDIRRFRYMAADYPDVRMVLLLPYCDKSSKQTILRANAMKYVERITYCNPLFKKFGIR